MSRLLRTIRLLALATAVTLVAGGLIACASDDDAGASNPRPTSEEGEPTPTEPASRSSQADPADAFRSMSIPGDLTDGYFFGDPDAPLQLAVYEDFQCPFCLQFTLASEPEIVEKFVLEGKLRLEFRNLPILGQDSANAAFAAQCAADADAFWPLHKELFLAQYEAGQLTDEELNVGRFAKEELLRFARTAGLDAAAFETCLADPATYDAVLTQAREANQLGIRSTPSFFLNGQPLARYPAGPAEWSAFLENALAE
ncbi:MAG: DsbA family protein [Dehalococcoidia bacterium]|nr:DsbA family protein [Dehalococcoidia bacterium]